jgi:hypothetical protein
MHYRHMKKAWAKRHAQTVAKHTPKLIKARKEGWTKAVASIESRLASSLENSRAKVKEIKDGSLGSAAGGTVGTGVLAGAGYGAYKYKKGKEKTSMDLRAWSDEFTKISRVFGASSPDDLISETSIPYSQRKAALQKYLGTKSRERPTDLMTALGVGGGVGAGMGVLMGLSTPSRKTPLGKRALIGALLGGAFGAGTGALARWADKDEISRSRRDRKDVSGGLSRRVVGKRQSDAFRNELRHQEMMGALRQRRY